MASYDINNERPPYVRFQVTAVEDKSKLLTSGLCGFKNVEMAYITRPGQKDTVVKEATQWLTDLEEMVRKERIPPDWLVHFRSAYKMWKEGLDIPVTGIPIRGWPVLLPALQEELLRIGIRTVEDLATANDEVQRAIGIGAADMMKKAKAWLESAKEHGVTVSRLEQLELDNQALRDKNAAYEARLAKLETSLAA